MEDSIQTQNKPNFVISLLAMVLAFMVFKEELLTLKLNFGFFNVSGYVLAIVFISLLWISSYLFALNYINTRFPKVYKLVNYLANVFYLLAVSFPIIVLILWWGNILIATIWLLNIENKSTLSNILLILTSFTSSFAILYQTRELQDKQHEILNLKFEQDKFSSIEKFLNLYKSKFYNESILEAYKTLDISVKKELENKGIYTLNKSSQSAFDEAAKAGILDKNMLANLKDLRWLRNQVAHMNTEFWKKEADFAKDLLRRVLNSFKE